MVVVVICYVILSLGLLFVTSLAVYGTVLVWRNKGGDRMDLFMYTLVDIWAVCMIGFMVFLWTRPHLDADATITDVENGDAHVVVDTVITERYVWNDEIIN